VFHSRVALARDVGMIMPATISEALDAEKLKLPIGRFLGENRSGLGD
jgi:hypothetical protein